MPNELAPTKPVHLSARGTSEFIPETLKGREPRIAFYIWIPTFAQRDSLSQLLFSFNVMPVTIEHGRSVLLSELYEVYYTDPAAAPPRRIEEEDGENPEKTIIREVPKLLGDPDEMAAFLEGYWQRADIYEQLIGQWALQEKERLIDQLHGAEEREGVPIPAAPYSPRETARAKRLAMEMLELSPAYCRLQSRYADYDAREDLMLFRLFVADWTGLDTPVARLRSGPLSEACLERLRAELEPLHPDPNQVYLEVVREVRSLMKIDGETEKNFESPLGQDSSQSGSHVRSDVSAAGDGSWMGSSTEPVPSSGSPPTSGTSSKSRSGSGARKLRRGRTGARS